MKLDKMVKEAVSYAKSNKGFNRILQEILIKYKTIGRFSGFIVLSNISEAESKLLGAVDYKLFGKKEGRLSIKKFIDYFSEGRFKGLVFEEFMKEYFKEELVTNKELKEKEEELRSKYFEGLIERAGEFSLGIAWLKTALEERNYGYVSIVKEYEENKEALRDFGEAAQERIYTVIKALSLVSFNADSLEPLPLFSSRITKDPHYFDIGTTSFRLLLFGLCYHLKEVYPQNIEEINEILYRAGIARDEISIFTTTYGISALNNGEEHLGWQGFCQNLEPLHVSIKNLNSVNSFKLKEDKVFVFENPIVFMEVIRELESKQIYGPSLICTSGQLNTASLMLLDKLYKVGATLYYSGDFDPEGLRIADKLKQRYKEKLVLWRYSTIDYLKIKGNKGFEGRENKLNKLESKELMELKEVMEREKLCGYQELLIEEYVTDIVGFVKG